MDSLQVKIGEEFTI